MEAVIDPFGGTEYSAARALAAGLLFQEADALDSRNWAGWLALYREDARFWVPAWLDENEYSSDPATQLSLIYHETRWGLEERAARLNSRKSVTTLPLPRTVHMFGGLGVTAHSSNHLAVRSNATVHVYDPRTADHHVAAVRYRHEFSRDGDGPWLIASKKIILINDRMPSVVDFYTV